MNGGISARVGKSLIIPATVIACCLLALNDFILRVYWPSWWTGKLGDFAWLFFFPIISAELLAWLLNAGTSSACHRSRTKLSGALVYLGVGLVFTLVKTAPAVHTALLSWAERLLGFPVGWRIDPSDLLALPAMLLSWQVWKADLTRRGSFGPGYQYAPAYVLPVALISVLLTIANGRMPEYGIFCLVPSGEEILAVSTYGSWSSRDGGISWQEGPANNRSNWWDICGGPKSYLAGEEITFLVEDFTISATPGEFIRITGGKLDGIIQKKLAPVKSAEKYYYIEKAYSPEFYPGPLHVVHDHLNGSLIFAMGYQGVLVYRAAENNWVWSQVGIFGTAVIDRNPRAWFELLIREMLLGAAVVFLSIGWVLPASGSSTVWRAARLIFVPIFIGLALLSRINLGPYSLTGYFYPLVLLTILLCGIHTASRAIDLRLPRTVIMKLAVIGILNGLVFTLVFLLWIWNLLPDYWLTFIASVLLVYFAVGVEKRSAIPGEYVKLP